MTIGIDPAIGGPSAGLMFSLGIYDTLTKGSLTDGKTIAGTGTIDAAGNVGPIGGIQQKIVGARDAGAELFLVPPDNCDEASAPRNGDMRLVEAPTMHSARESIEKWVADPDATLPTCGDDDCMTTTKTRAPTAGFDDVDPALAEAVLEIESHIAGDGWDQPARLYALVDTAALVAKRAGARAR